MAYQPLRLRRALTLTYSLLERSHGYKPQPFSSICAARPRRGYTSTAALFRRRFDLDIDKIGSDTILFDGFGYKHWLITVKFPKNFNIPRETMIDTYAEIAAQV